MNPTTTALLAEFETAARSAQEAEKVLRKELADRIAKMERDRAFAFRRTRLIRTLADATAGAEDEADAMAMQRRAVRTDIGWTGESDSHAAILDKLRPVGQAVWQCACEDPEATAANVHTELQTFEAWFETTHGKPFYVLFDVYTPEVPVVDF